jgi:hypothetical protein
VSRLADVKVLCESKFGGGVECGDDSGGAWRKQVGQLRHRDSKDMHMHASKHSHATLKCEHSSHMMEQASS